MKISMHGRLPYFASSVATPSWSGALSGGCKITNALQEYKRACYRNKFELGGEPGMLILIEETCLNHGENSGIELKDNVHKDSNWPELILKDSHC